MSPSKLRSLRWWHRYALVETSGANTPPNDFVRSLHTFRHGAATAQARRIIEMTRYNVGYVTVEILPADDPRVAAFFRERAEWARRLLAELEGTDEQWARRLVEEAKKEEGKP